MTMQRMGWALVGAMALCWAGAVLAQEETHATTFGTGEDGTRVKAHRLDFDYNRRTVVFDGEVVVEDPRVTIMAEQITMLLSTNNEPEVITAVENVRIEQDMRKVLPVAGAAAPPAAGAEFRRATCQRATYSVRSGLLVLTGRPKVMQGASTMTGSRIIFSRDDDKVKCEDAQLQIVPGEGGFQGLMAPRK
jgi:lipopolysaccharide transport protein LptA